MVTPTAYLTELLDLQEQNPDQTFVTVEEADAILSQIAKEKLDSRYSMQGADAMSMQSPGAEIVTRNMDGSTTPLTPEVPPDFMRGVVRNAPRIIGGIGGGIAPIPLPPPVKIGIGSGIGEFVGSGAENLFYGAENNPIGDAATAAITDAATSWGVGKLFSKFGPKLPTEIEKTAERIGQNTVVDDIALGQTVKDSADMALKQSKGIAKGMYDVVEQQTAGSFAKPASYTDAILKADQEILKDKSGTLGAQAKTVLNRLKTGLDETAEFTFEEMRATRTGINEAIRDSISPTTGQPTKLTGILEGVKEGLEKDIEGLARSTSDATYTNHQLANRFYKENVVPLKDKFAKALRKTAEEKPENLKSFVSSPASTQRITERLGVGGVHESGTPYTQLGAQSGSQAIDPIKQQWKTDLFQKGFKTTATGELEFSPKTFLSYIRKPQVQKAYVENFGKEEYAQMEKLAIEGLKKKDLSGLGQWLGFTGMEGIRTAAEVADAVSGGSQ